MKNVEKVSHDMSILKDEDGLFTTVSITNEDGKCVAAVTEFHSYQRLELLNTIYIRCSIRSMRFESSSITSNLIVLEGLYGS